VCVNQGTVRLTVEIETGADPISGRVCVEGEPPREFTGWLELTRLLAEVISA
jgi:hypothetical protein